MSEEIIYCVRGCVRPCGCTECAIADKPVHAPLRRQATDGYLCRADADRLRRWIAEIPDLYTTLDPYEAPVGDDSGRVSHGGVSGSPALVRLDVLALQDPATTASMIPYPGAEPVPWDGRLYVPDEIGTWAALLCEEAGIDAPIEHLYQAAGILSRHFDSLVATLWVDECYDAMQSVYRLLQTAHGVERPRPIGKCINVYERDGRTVACDAMLYAPSEGVRIRCRRCGSRYDGQRMLLVKMQEQRDREAAG